MLRVRPNGYKYKNYEAWVESKHMPYDYEKHGLIRHLLSSRITSTENETTKIVLDFYEKSLIFLMKYVDELKHFKDWAWRNW